MKAVGFKKPIFFKNSFDFFTKIMITILLEKKEGHASLKIGCVYCKLWFSLCLFYYKTNISVYLMFAVNFKSKTLIQSKAFVFIVLRNKVVFLLVIVSVFEPNN